MVLDLNVRRLTTSTLQEGLAVWRPDGSEIAFKALGNANFNIYKTTNGSNLTLLSTVDWLTGPLSWGAGTLIMGPDTTAPLTMFKNPATPQWSGERFTAVSNLPVVDGYARDNLNGSGLDKVVVFIRRNTDGKFWNLRNWSATSTLLNAAISGTTWRLSTGFTASTLPQGPYTVFSIAYDRAGNRSTITNQVFVDRVAPPVVTIDSLSNGATYRELPIISGTARDNPGGSGIQYVIVLLQRRSDGKYWTIESYKTGSVPPPH